MISSLDFLNDFKDDFFLGFSTDNYQKIWVGYYYLGASPNQSTF